MLLLALLHTTGAIAAPAPSSALAQVADPVEARDGFWHGMAKEITGGAVATPGAALTVGAALSTAVLAATEPSYVREGILFAPAAAASGGAVLVGSGSLFTFGAIRSYDRGLRSLGGTPAAHSPIAPVLLLAGTACVVGGGVVDLVGFTRSIDYGYPGTSGVLGPLAATVGSGLMLGGGVELELDAARRRTALWNARHPFSATAESGPTGVTVHASPFLTSDGSRGIAGISGTF